MSTEYFVRNIFHKHVWKHQRGSKENRCDARRWIKLDQDHVHWYLLVLAVLSLQVPLPESLLGRQSTFTTVVLLDRTAYNKRIGCRETSLIINKH
jgi:hypothetical protein